MPHTTPNLTPSTPTPPMQQPAVVGMSAEGKRRTRGITTAADIMLRCVVVDDHWHWRGARTKGRPRAWFPPEQRVITMPLLIGWLKVGELFKGPQKGDCVWQPVCGDYECCNPDHYRALPFSKRMKAKGIKRSALTIAKLCKSRAKNSRLSDADVAEIRCSGETLKALSARYGVAMSTISGYRNLKFRKPTGLFAGLI